MVCPSQRDSTVLYLFLSIFSEWSESIDGGGWTLVRRVKEGNSWHPATDSLAGTDEYGSLGYETSEETFSILFNTTLFNQFLFATGMILLFDHYHHYYNSTIAHLQ